MKRSNQHLLICICFVLFSFIQAYFLVCESFAIFNADITFQGSIYYRNVYPEIFANDPVMKNLENVYLPIQKFLCESLIRASGSYPFALKTLLFIYTALSLLSVYFTLNLFFPRRNPYIIAAFSVLISLVFINLAKETCGTFYGIGAAYARTTAAIYTPLLAAYLFRGKDLILGKFCIPKIVAFGIFCGLAGNFHPRTALMMLSTGAIYYLLKNWNSPKTYIYLALSGIMAGLLVSPCYISLAAQTAGKGFLDFLLHPVSVDLRNAAIPGDESGSAETGNLIASFGSFFSNTLFTLRDDPCFWLWKLTLPVYIIPFIILIIVWKKYPQTESGNDSESTYAHLRDLFVIAFSSMIILELITRTGGLFWTPLGEILGGIYFRGEKVIFFYFQLLAIYFMLNREFFRMSKIPHLLISASLLFCLLASGGTRFQFIKDSKYCLGMDFLEASLIYRIITALIAGLLLVLCLKLSKNTLIRNLTVAYFVILMMTWPCLSGGIRSAAGSFCDSFQRTGVWKMIDRIYPASNAEAFIAAFDDCAEWLRNNTDPQKDLLLTLTKRNNGHHLKLAAKRRGLGDPGEYGNTSIKQKLDTIYHEMDIEESELETLDLLIAEYSPTVILLEKTARATLPEKFTKRFPQVYANDDYVIYRRK